MYGRRWQPSKTAKREFAKQMDEISKFCEANGIVNSKSNDSYYFTIGEIDYRVSNHAVETSHYKNALGESYNYHGDSRDYRRETFCIHASKTRIIEIYTKLKNGQKVDHRGN